jgi:hypothetical protein
MVSKIYKLSDTITEDSKGLVIVVAFIAFIAVSNYKERSVNGPKPNEAFENNDFVY